jgi:hypothetical protein
MGRTPIDRRGFALLTDVDPLPNLNCHPLKRDGFTQGAPELLGALVSMLLIGGCGYEKL